MQRYSFDRAKPFYPLVFLYLVQLHGLKATCCFTSNEGMHLEQGESHPLRALLSPLTLKVTGDTDDVTVPVEEVADELVKNFVYLLPIYVQAMQAILSSAYETVKAMEHRSEAVEFLRHARNAAAHNGRWHFLNGEPRRIASWRGLTLGPDLHGTALIKLPPAPGTIELGDPIALLWDIEQEIAGAA